MACFSKIWLFLLVVTGGTLGRLAAQTQAVISADSGFWEPYPEKSMEFVAQPANRYWTIQDAQALADTVWKPLRQSYGTYLGISTKGYWLRFRVRNKRQNTAPVLPKFGGPAPDSLSLLLECNNPNLDTLRLYRVDMEGNVLKSENGNRFAPKARPLNYPNLVFRWKEPAGSSSVIYLYVRSLYYPANFSLSLWDEQRWQLSYKQIEIGASILFFALALMYLFTLTLLFAIVRERYLWLFYGYVFLSAIFIANDVGLWYWLWPDWNYRLFSPAILSLSTICGIWFVRYYFQSGRRYPYFDSVLSLLSALALAPAGLSLLFFRRPAAFQAMYKAMYFNQLAIYATVLGMVLYSYYAYRKRENIWFMIAFTPHGLAIVFTCLHQLGVWHAGLPGLLQMSKTPSPLFVQLNTPWLLLGGMLWEMLIVSLLFVVRIQDFYEASNRILAERRNALMLGVETERKRVAQDIHDGIGVLLSSSKMKLAALRDQLRKQSALRRDMDDVLANLDQAHEEMRDIAYNLMPKSLEKLGLAQAIEGTISRLRRQHPGIQWHFYSNFQNSRLEELTKLNLFRIAQEMLNNIIQHARATEAHLQLLRQENLIVLSVEDNGVGIPADVPNARTGVGLSNIRYRAEDVLKGHVTIESSPGKGTFIAVEVPVA